MQNLDNQKYSGLRELLNIELMTNYNNSIVEDSIKNKAHINTIVDYGAGIGTLSKIFLEKYNKSPLCIEIDHMNIKYLKERDFRCFQSFEEIVDPIDLIFSSNVLEHIENDLEILKIMRSKLKDNGMLFLYVPANMILWTKLDNIVGHYRRYEIDSLKDLCKNAGFRIERIYYADFLGFFMTIIWKIFDKVLNKSLPSSSALIFYDKFIFPISRFLDKVGFSHIIGKNIVVKAIK